MERQANNLSDDLIDLQNRPEYTVDLEVDEAHALFEYPLETTPHPTATKTDPDELRATARDVPLNGCPPFTALS